MQRRLTDGEAERIAKAYDALNGFPAGLDNSATQNCRMLLQDMLTHNTTDGLPFVEPPLTDEDARARPWVMVRDREDQAWKGPRKLAAKAGQFHIFNFLDDALTSWTQCRRAALEEIAAAGLEVMK